MTRSGRPLAVAALATTVAGGLLALLLPASLPAGSGFAALLVAGCAVVGSAGTAWLWVLTLLVVHDVLRGRTPRGGVPRTVSRVVLTACGLSLAGSLAAPAYADPEVLRGLPLPDRTTTTTTTATTTVADHHRVARHRVRVTPGDTLWGIAARDLGDDAPAAAVERRWREVYRANRDLVGVNPDLIHPGQQLLLPGTDDTSGRS